MSLPPAHPDWLIAVEVIAHPDAAKECITDIRGIPVPRGWAQAVRVGNLVYLGSPVALDGEVLQVIDDDTAHPIEVKGDIAAQTERVYEGIGAVLQAAGATWEDVVNVYQYATRNDIPFDRIRRARERYLTAGRFISTSVVCHPEHSPASTSSASCGGVLLAPLRKLQTDHGAEFPLAFALTVEAAGIRHRYIRPRSPKQSGKVERSHRIDHEEFWSY